MKLIIMTKSTFFVEEDKIISALFDVGMDILHLYKPRALPMYSERLLTLLPDDCYEKVMVHEHFYLKEEYGLRGIHLDDVSQPVPEKFKGKISRTLGLEDITKEVKKRCDYIFLKDTFSALTPDGGAFITDRLQQASDNGMIDKKTYAFGGVTLENIKLARELGFGGVVVDDDLWDKFDIHHQIDYKELISHYERLAKAVKA